MPSLGMMMTDFSAAMGFVSLTVFSMCSSAALRLMGISLLLLMAPACGSRADFSASDSADSATEPPATEQSAAELSEPESSEAKNSEAENSEPLGAPSLIDQAANPTGEPEGALGELSEEPALTVAIGEPLPPFTRDDLTKLTAEGEILAQSWFDLAGLGKATTPPVFTEALQAFRREAQETMPAIAPFLGTWHDDASIGKPYKVTIFPAEQADQVCLLEVREEQQIAQEIIYAPIFHLSVATVVEGELRSERLRTAQATVRLAESFTGDKTMLLSMDNGEGIYAFGLQSPPALPADLSPGMAEAVTEALPAVGCEALAIAGEP
ncbi:MAG: hypothetical protein AAF171_06460 [Cyanobacteria bacterium P01_A01_bin.116]